MNRPQEIILDLMRVSSFNGFDGVQVADALAANETLWQSAMITSEREGEGLTLRDLPGGQTNFSTVYILAHGDERDAKLLELAHAWGADEANWLTTEATRRYLMEGGKNRVLRLWWD